MTSKDYLFRILALVVVWTGITIPATKADLFFITEPSDLKIAVVVLAAACVLTFVVWCGPDLFRRRSK